MSGNSARRSGGVVRGDEVAHEGTITRFPGRAVQRSGRRLLAPGDDETVRPPPNNLPVRLTSFVGREQEISELGQLVASARLVTLTGSGGVGKSRLALCVADELAGAQRDGAWLVELAGLTSSALVPRAVASALSLRDAPNRPLVDLLVDALRRKALLLVLDNCEHLLSGCAALLEVLLPACSGLRILATSRAPLGVEGEVTWRVPSLSYPDAGRLPREAVNLVADPACYEAVRLFLERARAVLPTFELTPENAPALARVCQQLDGIPLALELAAARVRVLTPEQIAARLGDRFRLLRGGSRSGLPRHRTLAALIDWSYDLLDQPERSLLNRLSVFTGGWTLEAAEVVCGERETEPSLAHSPNRSHAPDVLELLTRLVDKSLVLVEERGGAARYRLLETVREYAAKKLEASGEVAALRARHAEWYLDLAETAEQKLRRADEEDRWLARLEDEHDNLRAALRWTEQQSDVAARAAWLRLIGALWWFWHLQGHASEAILQIERALAASEAAPPTLRSKLLTGAGFLFYYAGDYRRAAPLLERAIEISRQIDDSWGTAFGLTTLGTLAQNSGEYTRAEALLGAGLELTRQSRDTFNLARTLSALANVAYFRADYRRSERLAEESVAICRGLGSKTNLALALFLLGRAVQALGDDQRAETLLEESLATAREARYPRFIGRSLQYLASMARARGDLDRARRLYAESLALMRVERERRGVAMCLEGLAGVVRLQGQPASATRLLGAAEAIRVAIGVPVTAPERAIRDRDLAAVRAALSEVEFATAWADGRALPLEQLVAYALAPERPQEQPAAPAIEAAGEIRPSPLSPREREVARLIASGLTNREIALQLVIARRTAETHVGHILNKLGFSHRVQIAVWAAEQGLGPRRTD